MAASDPTPYVATPTGTLQGVAAFSWDGSAWQPTGRAGPDVATPTGVLQGVAPFSWSGSAWTPAGRAQPGVATPSGVLDGVAVYTWSGSAWVPTSGTATPSTPSGALRGVAAFSWDGAAWQPAGQARPSVPTAYGVLDGVAFFNWGGTTWQAGAAVPAGATLDISFLSSVLDPRITFTRASTGTYFDSSGTMQTAAANAPRWDYNPNTRALNGLLLEEARTNVLLNSATLGTQPVTVTAQVYALSFYGTGTITKSGVASGALVGTGATQRVSQTFTPTAGSLTLTVTGTVTNAQLEAGAFATSYIPTTGAAVTRAQDLTNMPTSPWMVPSIGSWFAEFILLGISSNVSLIGDPAGATAAIGVLNASNVLYSWDGAAVQTANSVVPNAICKGASAIASPTGRICLNGGPIGSGAQTGISGIASIGFIESVSGIAANNGSGYIRRVRYWPRVLSDAEMQAVTT